MIKDDKKQGRLSADEWINRTRQILRHRDDPIWLQSSPLARTALVEQIAKERYPYGVVARGRALGDLLGECLEEIAAELGNSARVTKLKEFIDSTREGKGVKESGKAIGVSPEYASRYFQYTVVKLVAEKLMLKMHLKTAPPAICPSSASKPGVRLVHLAVT